jgi:hypothetical protein
LLRLTAQLVDAYIELADHRQNQYALGEKYPLTNKLKQIKWSGQSIRIPTADASGGVAEGPEVERFDGWTYPGLPPENFWVCTFSQPQLESMRSASNH